MSEPKWKDFDLSKLVERAEKADAPYLEFLRVPQLSCGIYTLPVGSTDNQSTHDEDEVYLVLSGKARMRLDDEQRDVGPGSLLYVGATTEHSFFQIEEDMTLLVFFAASPPDRG